MSKRVKLLVLLIVALGALCLGACDPWGDSVRVKTRTLELVSQESCLEHFIPHKLSFANGIRVREIGLYLNNGSGLAINDLDSDGDQDIVFTGVDREVGIFWNLGDLEFQEEKLDEKFPRGVAIVDVDGDNHLDLVFTHRGFQGVTYWRNLGRNVGGRRFVQDDLPGVDSYAYTMAWGDINGDELLDLVTGSYNVELIQNGIDIPERDPRAGVFYYEQTPDGFIPQRLAMDSQSLSIALVDLDNDEQVDIWVTNDFDLPDYIWLRHNQRWDVAEPFLQTPHSSMSTEWGFIANDKRLALFSTDMMPYDHSAETMAAWQPVMDGMMGDMGGMEMHHDPADPQIMANVLQMPRNGAWDNEAQRRGVDSAGWAWSAKFGDLDLDGFLDLYIVNGMIGVNMLSHLPNHELVEANQAYQNLGNGVFALAPEWALGATESGRGMVMADMDMDGDLDIVINNLRDSACIFENQLCGNGNGLEVNLAWPKSRNPHAIGAKVSLQTAMGNMTRDVRASGGYLSGNSFLLHFGVPPNTEILEMTIIWPDGRLSKISNLEVQTLVDVTRR